MHGIKDESSGDEPKKAEVKVLNVSLDNIWNKKFLLIISLDWKYTITFLISR